MEKQRSSRRDTREPLRDECWSVLARSAALPLLVLAGCAIDVSDESSTPNRSSGTAISSPAPASPMGASHGASASRSTQRVPFLGGAFVTWNEALPIEVHQAVAGAPTDRPVIVWAGR